MILASITSGTYTAGTNIPLTTIHKTNCVYKLNNSNAVVVNKAGITDFKANIVITSIGANAITAQLYANGVAVQGAISTLTTVASEEYTLNINYPVLVERQFDSDKLELTVQLNQDCTLVGGTISAEYCQ